MRRVATRLTESLPISVTVPNAPIVGLPPRLAVSTKESILVKLVAVLVAGLKRNCVDLLIRMFRALKSRLVAGFSGTASACF